MEKKSIVWINTLRALCIVSVFLVHTQSYYGKGLGEVNWFIHTFYVNAFFFVSGYLMFLKQLRAPTVIEDRKTYMSAFGGGYQLLFNIIFRIVIPSIIFSAIEFIPSCIIQGRGIGWGYALFKTIGGGTYWFTSALVVAELILLFLFCTRRDNIWFYAASSLIMGVAGMMIVHFGVLKSDIWAWKQGLLALIFLVMGGLYWRYEKQIDKLMQWWFALPLVVIYVAMVILLKDYTDPLISTLTLQPLGFVTSAMACLLLVWLCKIVPGMKPFTFIGQNSLGFYFMSGALPITFSIIANKLLINRSIFMMLAIWIACVVVAYIAVAIINLWLPWMWDLRRLRK